MGKAFAKVNLCHTGDFPSGKEKTTNEEIQKWVEGNGGTVQQAITSNTTHLICSEVSWKRYASIVKEARCRNKKLPRREKIRIVTLEWLMDCLMKKPVRPRDTKDYEWEQSKLHLATARGAPETTKPADSEEKKVKKIDRQMLAFSTAIADFETDMQATGYHPYIDSTGFIYLIVLARRDILKNTIERHRIKVRYSSLSSTISYNSSPRDRTSGTTYMHATLPIHHFCFPRLHAFARYPVVEASLPRRLVFRPSSPHRKLRVPIPNPWAHCLQLFESDAIPHTYACYTSYTTGIRGIKKEPEELVPLGSDWSLAWGTFTKVFELKTGVAWGMRVEAGWADADTNGLRIDGAAQKRTVDGAEKQLWEYVQPKTGMPQGLKGIDGSAEIASEGAAERRASVTLVMPSGALPERDDVKPSARTPDGGW